MPSPSGPLRGIPVIEMAGLGPAPGRTAVLRLIAQADALVEGPRPGAMERPGVDGHMRRVHR